MSEDTPVFDRRDKYDVVAGDSRAAFFQGGHYFDPQGRYLSFDEAAQPTPNGSFNNAVEAKVAEREAERNAGRPLKLIDETNPHTNNLDEKTMAERREAAQAAAAAREASGNKSEEAERAQMRENMEQMHVTKIRTLTKHSGLPIITGKGAKAKMIDALMDATE